MALGQPSDDLKCADEGLLQVVFGLPSEWRDQFNVYMIGSGNAKVPIDMLPYLFDGEYIVESKSDLSTNRILLNRNDHMPINIDEHHR